MIAAEVSVEYISPRTKVKIKTKIVDTTASKTRLKNLDKIKESIILIKKSQDPYSVVIKEDLLSLNRILDEILPQ